ncbi:MAG: tRNA 2-thiouridine(34) synthase MnmA [Bacteroidetes bacterium]|jgi:tRNA-uridine 2-sulfurtransferase|nr:tRNA 2-thiouridine(34) synthase MnmA [Bacteroidota bacterium]MBT3750310.1 tRNA 2-thiouridine(34) synthase MnmA [Bacteroidota bacterium]MBT4399798.1 tRNA 2-thiouridine(34) synthase MnmA [Bacteroidota bacterium]MBT4410299.1 tRNA 2-thiouridine(34) synthase MnmA [Bacteroidota bacterium]MBT5426355.1 tRNA 2-thiouridine(34) synthase MnmA [Bacteroidota bacterium]
MNKKRVVVGISGGVDSGVAAYVLQQQGYDVVGLFMRNWHDTTGLKSAACSYEDDILFAEMVANKLGILLHEVDLSGPYRKRVIDYLFKEYEAGRTPNPDVLCNREIKFDAFAEEALKLGADFLATGHYCRKESIETDGVIRHRLLAGLDDNKDQSYFLCQLNQKQLETALFPIGELTKPEVRQIAREQNLANADRKDSQGICFVGKVDLPTFLQQQLAAKEGDVIEIPPDSALVRDMDDLFSLAKPYAFTPELGDSVGKHKGAHFYTVGQRKGLNIGGKPEPLFVIGTDVVKNILYVGQGQNHPLLFKQALFIRNEDMHWIRPDLALANGEERDFLFRIRYRQKLQEGTLFMKDDGGYVHFKDPQRAVVSGQFAAFYQNDELIGSGVIHN